MRLLWLLFLAAPVLADGYGYGPRPGYVVPSRPVAEMRGVADQLVHATADLHTKAEEGLYRGGGDRRTVALLDRLARLAARLELDSGEEGASSPAAREDFEQLLEVYQLVEERVAEDVELRRSFVPVRALMERLIPMFRG